jgi:hypothetical protein
MPPKSRRLPRVPQPRKPGRRRDDVSRAEFNDVLVLLRERGEIITRLRHDLDIQFRRIADLQGELDRIKHAWQRVQTK